ncbi:hypothetical protein Q6A90_08645 [Aliarcobacter skirrowii]|nr:hypothetical protein [Aliarcobacter skirrowii]MDX4062432.1 hypothetical protein [Aliarcobacter skirrowii]
MGRKKGQVFSAEFGMSKASICRTFEVKRSTLIDSLNRENI